MLFTTGKATVHDRKQDIYRSPNDTGIMFKAIITVKLRPSILDPEGKAIEHALNSLDFKGLSNVRVGKEIELNVDVASEAEAAAAVDKACSQLLANPVMEDYLVKIEKVQ